MMPKNDFHNPLNQEHKIMLSNFRWELSRYRSVNFGKSKSYLNINLANPFNVTSILQSKRCSIYKIYLFKKICQMQTMMMIFS